MVAQHTPQIRMMLSHGVTSTREVAQAVGCSERLVRHVRQQMGLPYPSESPSRQLARLEQELRQLRKLVILLQGRRPRETYVAQ